MNTSWFRRKDKLGSLVLFVVGVVYLYHALAIPEGLVTAGGFTSRTLPQALGVLLIALATVQLVRASHQPLDATAATWQWRPVVLLLVLMAAYAGSFRWLGFVPASVLFLVLGFRVLGERRLLVGAGVASALVVSLWLLLTQAFGLYLEPGVLFQ